MSNEPSNEPIFVTPSGPSSGNSIIANTTNHRRAIMFVATMILGVLISLVVYKIQPLTYREFIFPPLVGLVVFELLFRTKQRLRLAILPIYFFVCLLVSQVLYGFLYSATYGYIWTPFMLGYLFSEFPLNLYILMDSSMVTGLAYYLIKIYRQESWEIQGAGTLSGAGNEPIGMHGPVTDFSSFLTRYQQHIWGFTGWYLLATIITPWSFGLISTPATIICLIVYGFSKTRKGIAGGILAAVSLNFVISLVRSLPLNAWCFIPFYYTGF